MKRLLFSLLLALWAQSQAVGADATVSATFVADATAGIARSTFETIGRFYKRGFPPGELVPSKQYPVRIAFSESDATDLALEQTYKSVTVSGTASIAAENVEMLVDDASSAANKERAKDPEVWVEVRSGRLRVKAGKYGCAGRFLVNGKRVAITAGEAAITSTDGPVSFSSGTSVTVDGMSFTYSNGQWAQSLATPSQN